MHTPPPSSRPTVEQWLRVLSYILIISLVGIHMQQINSNGITIKTRGAQTT